MVKRFFYRIFCGFFLGLSVFAPGFSGSIVAILLGIYQSLVNIIANPFKNLRRNILFCIPLAIGVVISGVLFVITFNYLFAAYEKATYLLFVGLIFGNLPVILTEIKKCGFHKRYLIGAIAAFAAALALGIFSLDAGQASGLGIIAPGTIIIALSGLVGGAVALIPGMSVTMVLMFIGVYRYLISTVDSFMLFDFTRLVPFGLFAVCAIAGLILASKGIKYVFGRFPGFANSMVFGFMSGSLVSILVASLRMNDANFNWLLGTIMLIAGLGVSILFVIAGRSINKENIGEI